MALARLVFVVVLGLINVAQGDRDPYNTGQSQDKCRILALRGGGAHGSFEVGVLKAFVDHLDPEEVQYDYVSGVSAGAMNGAYIALYEKGNERDAIEYLESIYLKYPPTSFWSTWSWMVFAPFWKNSFLDNSNMQEIFDTEYADKPFKRKFTFQSVDLVTGKVVMFDETTPMNIRNKAVRSSCSIPAIFPPVNIDDYWLVDGGLFQNLALGDPIERCREDGFDDKDIVVDIIMCLNQVYDIVNWSIRDTLWYSATDFFDRSKYFSRYYAQYEDMYRMTRGYPHINFRHVVAPRQDVPSYGFVPLFAKAEDIKKEINIGYEDGYQAIMQSNMLKSSDDQTVFTLGSSLNDLYNQEIDYDSEFSRKQDMWEFDGF